MTKAKTKESATLFGPEPVQGAPAVGDKVTGHGGKIIGVHPRGLTEGTVRKGGRNKPVSQIAVRPPPPAPIIRRKDPPADPFLAMVREVALNPNLDVGRLDALLKMQERIIERNARRAFDDALAEVQGKLPVIDRKGRIVIHKKDNAGKRTKEVEQSTAYAKIEDIVEAVAPVLVEHGFAVSFRTGLDEQGRVRVTTILSGHGHREETLFVLPHDSTGSKNAVQAIGSSTSYGKRMGLCARLKNVSRGEDDDAQATGAPLVVGEVLSAEQLEQIVDLANAVECSVPHLLAHLNKTKPNGHPDTAELAHLPAARFDEIVAALRGYEANKKAREQEPKK